MAAETLEQRVDQLENRFRAVEQQIAQQASVDARQKRGWRWFVGIFSESPDFDDVVRIGQEWRNQDIPNADTDEES